MYSRVLMLLNCLTSYCAVNLNIYESRRTAWLVLEKGHVCLYDVTCNLSDSTDIIPIP